MESECKWQTSVEGFKSQMKQIPFLPEKHKLPVSIKFKSGMKEPKLPEQLIGLKAVMHSPGHNNSSTELRDEVKDLDEDKIEHSQSIKSFFEKLSMVGKSA